MSARASALLGLLLATAIASPVAAQPVLELLDRELTDASARLMRSVVSIELRGPERGDADFVASGVVIDQQHHVLTTDIPAPMGEQRLVAVDSKGRRYPARWIGRDDQTRLTLVALERADLAPPTFSDAPLEAGSWAILVGNPYGLRHSIRYGNVSGIQREVQIGSRRFSGMIEFTALLRPGDSGALLANRKGEMIGIVRGSLMRPDTQVQADLSAGGIGFAIPVGTALQVATQLREHGRVERGYLGVVADVPPVPGAGADVLRVVPGSPADKAGLKPGDRILSVDSNAIDRFDDLVAAVEDKAPASQIQLVVRREEDQFDVTVVLGEKPEQPGGLIPFPPTPLDPLIGPFHPRGMLLGVQTQPVTVQLQQHLELPQTEGALVNDVVPHSPAAEAGLKPLDVIVALDGEPVRSPEELSERLHRAGPGKKIQLQVWRDGKQTEIPVTLSDDQGLFPPLPAPETIFPRSALERRVETLERRVEQLERRIEQLERQPPPSPQ